MAKSINQRTATARQVLGIHSKILYIKEQSIIILTSFSKISCCVLILSFVFVYTFGSLSSDD